MHIIGNIQIQKLARSKHNFHAWYLAPQAMTCGIGLVVNFRFDNLCPNGAPIDFTDNRAPKKLGCTFI